MKKTAYQIAEEWAEDLRREFNKHMKELERKIFDDNPPKDTSPKEPWVKYPCGPNCGPEHYPDSKKHE